MKQKGLFFEEEDQRNASSPKSVLEKSFPALTLENLLSDKFIDDNGMFGLRMLLKRARKRGQLEQYKRVLNAEIEMKKGENTLKNNLRHVLLWETMGKFLK